MRRPVLIALALLALALLQALLLPTAQAEPLLVQCRPDAIDGALDDGQWSRGPIAGFARGLIARQDGWLILGFEPFLPGPDWVDRGTRRWSCRSEPLGHAASAPIGWASCTRIAREGLVCRQPR